MKIIKHSRLYLAFSIALAALLITGCQKETINDNEIPNFSQLQKLKQDIQTKIEAEGYEQKFEISKRLQTVYLDMDGNVVTDPISPNFVSVCGGNDPVYADVGSYTRAYVCGNGYLLSVEWLVSWDNNIVNTSPTNPLNKTTCGFKVSIPGNANAYVENVTAGVVITDLGADPDNAGNNIFSIRATATTYLSPSIVNTSGAILRLSAKFVSDCASLDQYPISPTSVVGLGWDVPLSSAACDRNDKAWFNWPGSYYSNRFIVWGYDPLGGCPSYTAGVAPTAQHIQYSLDNGATWNSFNASSSPFSPINTSSFVDRTNFLISPVLASGTYNIKIRYANVKHNTGISVYTIPTSSNSCITGGWGTEMWTTESFTGVVVP